MKPVKLVPTHEKSIERRLNMNKDFIKFLNEHNVRYLLIGGWAVGIYGNPRATKDIDFLIAVEIP